MASLPAYAELHSRSNFSFLTGASSPEELVERAAALRYSALAITDECSLAGVVHAYEQATASGLALVIGAEMRLEPSVGGLPMRLVLLATSRRGYANLSQWISLARRRAQKGSYEARTSDLEGWVPTLMHLSGLPDCLALLLPTAGPVPAGAEEPDAGQQAGRGPKDAGSRQPGGGNAVLSTLDVIARASAKAQASLATRVPGAGRPRARQVREARDGPDTVDDPSAPPAPKPAAVPSPAPSRASASAASRSGPAARPAIVLPFESLFAQAQWLKTWFGDRAWLAMPLLLQGQDDELRERVKAVSAAVGLRIVAVGDVLMARRADKPLQDMLTATRLKRSIEECGDALSPNAEAHLRSRARLQGLYDPAWLAESVAIAGRCEFSLRELSYEYPQEIVPVGHTPTSWLRTLVEQGAAWRFPQGMSPKVRGLVEHELDLIQRKRYEAYFLTVSDIVHWARSRNILCQGRGSAANSVVCYCLGVTAVSPDQMAVLFERFISEERDEPPDIDIDFEHQRREEVIQYIYRKYSRRRVALTAVVIRYRMKSAVRDVGRALGVDLDRIEAVSRGLHRVGGDAAPSAEDRLAIALAENGFDPSSRLGAMWIRLAMRLRNQPRHLSQHPGGFLIAGDDVAKFVPVENAAMDDRTVIQWDKDDLDVLRLIKVDILALGMLSALRRALAFVEWKRETFLVGPRPRAVAEPASPRVAAEPSPRALSTVVATSDAAPTASVRPLSEIDLRGGAGGVGLHHIPQDDSRVYAMLSAGDSVGVFQVESRAQMSMLPRLRPETFYDLVIEVAIVRPGPIQGGMVHPYLRRRQGLEPEIYPSDETRQALERTKGVPIFQEQVMQLAMLAADFTPGEADQLRRAMAAWKRKGGLGPFHEKLTGRMVAKGYTRDYAEAIFRQIEGFGEYGFPESHAASFALLVYDSAWIKRHHPDAFLAALLNSLPMGFYAAPQLVRDARAHGVVVRPVDVAVSDWDSTLEEQAPAEAAPLCDARFVPDGQCAVRLGLGRIAGLAREQGERIVAARAAAPFVSVEDLARRAGLDNRALASLAAADALASLSGDRREALWAVSGVDTRATPLLRATRTQEAGDPALERLALGDEVLADYRALGLSLKSHPLALLRPALSAFKVERASVLNADYRSGQLARASGLVTHRQQPGTAKGVIFVTLEDETGAVNVIVWPAVASAQRRPLLAASLLTVYGVWQREGEVRHLVAKTLVDHSALLDGLVTRSRDFH